MSETARKEWHESEQLSIVVPVTPVDADKLFFDEQWASGSFGSDAFELSRTVTGNTIRLQVTRADGSRVVETVTVNDLVKAWLTRILGDEKEGDDE